MYTRYEEIINQINEIGKGDIVYLISDVLNLAKQTAQNGERFDKNAFIDSILRKVGEEGTVLIPTFSWRFSSGGIFDYRNTPSESGALGNAALKRDDFTRTKHPMYSFCVWGKDKERLFNMDPVNGYGTGTVFEYIIDNNGKALIIDLPTMNRNVICHHIEKIAGVPFRFEKEFTSDYIDWNGKRAKKTYSIYVRHYEYEAQEHLAPMNSILEVMGVTSTRVINGIPFRVCDEKQAAELLYMDMKYNDCRNTYVYKGQKPAVHQVERFVWD